MHQNVSKDKRECWEHYAFTGTSIAIDSEGRKFVSNGKSVKAIDTAGKAVEVKNVDGSIFKEARGVCVDHKGRLVIADYFNRRLQLLEYPS